MKKIIICMILMITILFSNSAFAEEEFNLHSGTKFGMSVDEVIKLEQEAGFDVEDSHLENDGYLEIRGKIAGYDDVIAKYYFTEDGTLHKLYYHFVSEDNIYQELEKNLEKKYGPTEYNSFAGVSLPIFTVDGYEYSKFRTGVLTEVEYVCRFSVLERIYSQRIIQITETESVYIECEYSVSSFDTFKDGQWISHPAGSTSITYQFLDTQATEEINSFLKQRDNDL